MGRHRSPDSDLKYEIAKCEICGREFKTQSPYKKICSPKCYKEKQRIIRENKKKRQGTERFPRGYAQKQMEDTKQRMEKIDVEGIMASMKEKK